MGITTPHNFRSDEMNNRLMNGNFDLWQRNTTFAISGSGDTATADRWKCARSNAATATISRSGSVPDMKSLYSLQYTVGTADSAVAAGDYTHIYHPMEGYDFQPLYGKTFTYSFWVNSSITGVMPVSFRNNGATRSYVTNVTINAANTWEKKFITVTHDTTGSWNFENLLGMFVTFGLMGGTGYQAPSIDTWQTGNYTHSTTGWNFNATTGNTIRISQAKINLGANASAFSLYGGTASSERVACQRYYEANELPTTYIGSVSTNNLIWRVTFLTIKRAAPTVTTPTAFYYSGGSPVSFVPTSYGVNQFNFAYGSGSLASAQGFAGGSYTADAEL